MNISTDKRTRASASTTPLGLNRTNISAIFLEVIAPIFIATIVNCSPADGNTDTVGGIRGSNSFFSSELHEQQQFSGTCNDDDDSDNEDDDDEEVVGALVNDDIASLAFKYLSNLSKSDRITFHSSPSTLSNDL